MSRVMLTCVQCLSVQVYEVNRKLLQEHAAPLMAVYLHGVAVVRQELNMDVGRKSITGERAFHHPAME